MRSLSRFALVIVGAVAASIIWLAVVVSISTTPQEARERRSTPELPAPTVSLERKILQQVAWHPCDRTASSTTVRAIPAPPERRSVVTALAPPGRTAKTGTVLVRVAGEPLVAVVGDGVLYRDLGPGASGPDVRMLTAAMAQAGWLAVASDRLEASDVSTWHERTGLEAEQTIRWRNLVVVPPKARVGAAQVSVGDGVKANDALLTVRAHGRAFTCEVIDADPSLDTATVRFEVAGEPAGVAHLRVSPRNDESPGSIEVTPEGTELQGSAQLGIVSGGTDKPVLAAPLSALRTDTDGGTVVEAIDGERSRTVQVDVGASAQGWVEISGSDLDPGTRVRLFGPDRAGGPTNDAD